MTLGGTLRRAVAVGSIRRVARLVNFAVYDTAGQDDIDRSHGVAMSPTVSVRNGARVSIGSGAHIGQWSSLWAGDSAGRIVIDEHALLAPHVFVTASNYAFAGRGGPVMDLPRDEADVHIGADTWLGVGVVVLPGVTIGRGAVVAAGAVVVDDLPAGCLAGGVPARVIRDHVRVDRTVAK